MSITLLGNDIKFKANHILNQGIEALKHKINIHMDPNTLWGELKKILIKTEKEMKKKIPENANSR